MGKEIAKLSGSFNQDFSRYAGKKLLLLAILNAVPALLVVCLVTKVDANLDSDIFQASAAFLAIITAVVTFYGGHAEDEVDWLYQEKARLLPVGGNIDGLGRRLLRSIFLQYVLWWSLLASGAALGLSTIQLLDPMAALAGVYSLTLLMASAITVVYWMTLFIFSSTSGKGDYEGLMKPVDPQAKLAAQASK